MKGDSSPRLTTDCRLTYGCLPDCTTLFGALPRGRGPMPRSLRSWASPPEKAPRLPRRNRRLGVVLDCTNTYKEGCSASAARQAVGGERWSSHEPRRAIHRLALWVGGLSTAGVMGRMESSPPNHTESKCGFAAADPTARDGELRMNYTDKPMPIASLPDNWSAFNGREVLPWDISRAEAAATLRRARSLRARGQATVSTEAVGRYRLSTFNTLILNTKRS